MGEETRCFSCFEQYRRQVGALPLTITESPVEDTRNGSDLLSNGSSFPKSQSPAMALSKKSSEAKVQNGSLVRDESMDGFELTTAPPQKRARLVKEESEESVDI
uniref:Uncharacterized protein n=1 Tax=Ditylenchus dipsaci TaxID=166011 RepID=A0A915DCM5_9BILA